MVKAYSMRARSWLSGLIVMGALLGTSAAARAQDTRDPAAAEELFRQGRTAAEKKDYTTACSKFRESNRLDPAVGTVFNIADCEEKLGRLATSWTLFQEVVQRLPASDDRRGIAEKRLQKLEPRVPKLTIHLARSDRSDIVVKRDGVTLGNASLDTPLPVDPGDHTVVVEAPGTRPAEFHATIAEGQSNTLAVNIGEAAPTTAISLQTPVPETPQPAPANHTGAYVVGGIGAAALVTGVVAGVLTLGKKSTVNSECVGKECTQAGVDAASSGKTLGVITTVGLITGAVGLGAATYLFVSAPSPAESARGSAYLVGVRSAW